LGHEELYNLKDDPKEEKDLSKGDAQRTAELHEKLLLYLKEVNAQLPQPNPDHDPGKAHVRKPEPKREAGTKKERRRRP